MSSDVETAEAQTPVAVRKRPLRLNSSRNSSELKKSRKFQLSFNKFNKTKHGSKLGSLNLYGTPFFVIVFVLAIGIISACQWYGQTHWRHNREAPIETEFIPHHETDEELRQYDMYKEQYDINSPSAWFSDLSFVRLLTIIIWVTTVVTGLGAEAIVGQVMMKVSQTDTMTVGWKFAQLVFSLFALVSLFSGSVFGTALLGGWAVQMWLPRDYWTATAR